MISLKLLSRQLPVKEIAIHRLSALSGIAARVAVCHLIDQIRHKVLRGNSHDQRNVQIRSILPDLLRQCGNDLPVNSRL